MEKMEINELNACTGGNILTFFNSIFISVINMSFIFKRIIGGRK